MIFKKKYNFIFRLWKSNNVCITYFLIFIIFIFLIFIIFIFLIFINFICIQNSYSNTFKEGFEEITDAGDLKILKIIKESTELTDIDRVNLPTDRSNYDENERRKLSNLYLKIGYPSRDVNYVDPNNTRTLKELVETRTALFKDRDTYRAKYHSELSKYNKSSAYKNYTQLKNDCKTFNKQIDNIFPEIITSYGLNPVLSKYLDLQKLYDDIVEIKIYLNYIIKYDTSGIKFNISDSANSDFLNSITFLNNKLNVIYTDINTYIKYSIDDYNESIQKYITKINNMSSIITKLIKDLNILKFNDLLIIKDRMMIYGMIANVNQNFFNNHLEPTIRNGKYKSDYKNNNNNSSYGY